MTQLLYYKNLCKEDLWLDCADKLTAMIQNIIEFAKLIPGFMRLSQDDQVCYPEIFILSPKLILFSIPDPSVKNRLLRTRHHSNVTSHGSIAKRCALRWGDATSGGVLHVQLDRDEAGRRNIWDCKEYCWTETDGNRAGVVSESGASMARWA